MENWEDQFSRVQAPDSSVPSHREGLRKKLQSGSIRGGHGHRAIATLGLTALIVFSGLTVVYPGWATDLWKSPLVQTITLRTRDGHTVVVKKFPSEACLPADCDTSGQMMFIESGERRTIVLEASVENVNMMGRSGETITIETPDCDKIWIANGDTVDSKDLTMAVEEWSETGADADGNTSDPKTLSAASSDFGLQQNYPNPFNPTTQIAFDLNQSGPVTLKVYNLMGQEIATLLDGFADAGHHSVTFDGAALPSGYYLYTLQAAGHQVSKTMILAK